MLPKNIILSGITGSKAYNLDTATSDTDIRGIFIEPTENVLSIKSFKEVYDNVNPDFAYYEIGKAIKLFMQANPTVLEMLFLEHYESLTEEGKLLIENRNIFLSNKAKNSYGGYAIQQARSLNARGGTYGRGRNQRFAKHSRHCLRLLYQGQELLETGTLTVRLSDEKRKEIFAFGELPVDEVIDIFENKFRAFKDIKSVLPDEPDVEAINKLLLHIRKKHL